MPATGDTAVLRYGADSKWHWVFLSPSGSAQVLNFSSNGTPSLIPVGTSSGNLPLVPLPMSVMPVAKSRIDVHAFFITIGPTARRSGHFDLTVPAGMSQFFNVIVYQSAAPGTNKGQRTDAREFDQIQVVAAITSDTTLRCEWICNGPVIGNFNFFYQIKN